MQPSQAEKATSFRDQHHSGSLLILPNIWDPLGVRLMEKIGYPSVATASIVRKKFQNLQRLLKCQQMLIF